MRDTKIVCSLRQAIQAAGLRDGMRISFHHNFRNGDLVFNQVYEAIRSLGIKNLTLHCSGVFDCWNAADAVRDGTITAFEGTGISNRELAAMVSEGRAFQKPVLLDSHGGRASMVETGRIQIDVAFIGAPTCDCMGNMTGKRGPSAFGTMAYSMVDAQYADKVIAITDNLVPYPVEDYSIPESRVDYVVAVERIGDPAGIQSGVVVMTKDPARLLIAQHAAKVIQFSGMMDAVPFGYQAGAGGIAMAVNRYLADTMRASHKRGDFMLGLITKQQVDMLADHTFRALMDPQTADVHGIASCGKPGHAEVSTSHYASPTAKSALVDQLSVAVLGATEVDVDFNCNCLTDAGGKIVGGIGGHSDAAEGAKVTILALPLLRRANPCVVERVATVVTPGKDVDVVVTEVGIAVNPGREELAYRLKSAGLPVVDIHDMQRRAAVLGEAPVERRHGAEPVAHVYHRGQYQIDTVWKSDS
ncbi:citrate lyase subunit alpha [uncultured Oscillibacter sp.]|uniref:citrate lyase subunit alpha n=1 Tax=uncultured Oscillibacter sp. TaxID=876091 RepID=UPI0025F134D1|nr:citrate lyase subunit alpha [uncultured Oscillibacter sp.]